MPKLALIIGWRQTYIVNSRDKKHTKKAKDVCYKWTYPKSPCRTMVATDPLYGREECNRLGREPFLSTNCHTIWFHVSLFRVIWYQFIPAAFFWLSYNLCLGPTVFLLSSHGHYLMLLPLQCSSCPVQFHLWMDLFFEWWSKKNWIDKSNDTINRYYSYNQVFE